MQLAGGKTYRFAWYIWSYEVFALLVGILGIFVGFRRLRILTVTLFAVYTPIFTIKIDELLTVHDTKNPTGKLGSSIDATIAGLIIVVITNFLLILSYGWSEYEDSHAVVQVGANGDDNEKKSGNASYV